MNRERTHFVYMLLFIGILTFCAAPLSLYSAPKTMEFNFTQEELSSILKKYAKKRKLNLLLPQGVLSIQQKVTFRQAERIDLDKAGEYIKLFLELAGYTMYPQGDLLVISKIDDKNTRNTYPIYINTPVEQLPRTQEHIHAIYYLANLKVPENNSSRESINLILQDMLTRQPDATWFFDQKLNAIILTDRADSIGAAMNIILMLDASGSKEIVEVMPLSHTSADLVEKLFKEQIWSMNTQTAPFKATAQTESAVYFESNIKMIKDSRTNSLVIIGRENAIERVKEFIREYIDVPLDSGTSILHVYDLQYLDSQEFADVLQKIVSSTRDGQQSTSGEKSDALRIFEGVRVSADTIKPIEQPQKPVSSSSGGALTQTAAQPAAPLTIGGNRLVIAARNDDWIRIKKLIQELDQPQLQVIFEILVIDVTLTGDKELASQLHAPSFVDLPKGVQFQSAEMAGPVLNNKTSTDRATSLNADLLRPLAAAAESKDPYHSLAYTQSSELGVGATMVSFKEPCANAVWLVLKMLQNYGSTKIVAHPFIVTLNNKMGFQSTVTNRRGTGKAEQTSTTTYQNVEDFSAKFAIDCTPRISSLERLGFQFNLEYAEFESPNVDDFQRFTRSLSTYVNMQSGDLLALGGLTRNITVNATNQTPILSQIPIIGNLFRGRSKSDIKSRLVVLIVPTIVQPKFPEMINVFSKNKIDEGFNAIEDLDQSVIEERDPIQRFFFGSNSQDADSQTLREYMTDSASPALYANMQAEAQRSLTKTSKDLKELYKNLDNPLASKTIDIPVQGSPQHAAKPCCESCQKMPSDTQKKAAPDSERCDLTCASCTSALCTKNPHTSFAACDAHAGIGG